MSSKRSTALLVSLAAGAAILAGCGSSTLSKQERAGLNEQAVTLQTELATSGEQASKCATEDKIKKGGLEGVGNCLGKALDKSSAVVTQTSDFVKKLAGNASGDCKSKLNDFAGALDETAGTLGNASELAKQGQIQKIEKELQGLTQEQVDSQVAARDADKACGG
ncbi:MAG: hypothetical protein ACKOB9_00925 [Solirubrobacterales bacterium]